MNYLSYFANLMEEENISLNDKTEINNNLNGGAKNKNKGGNEALTQDSSTSPSEIDEKSKEIEKNKNENVSEKDNIKFQMNKISDFRTKCFYADFDEREFNFIESLNSNPYYNVEFSKTPQNKDIRIEEPEINVSKNFVLKPTDYVIQDNKKFKNIENRNLNELIDKNYIIDPKAEYNHLLHSYHNKLVYYTSKAKLVSNNINFDKSVKFYVSQPSSSIIYDSFKFVSEFIETTANFRRHADFLKPLIPEVKDYKLKTNDLNISNDKVKINYNLFTIPREIIEIINHINYYFNDVKEDLKYNEETGHYEMDVKNFKNNQSQKIPIMCKHVYMTLSGESLYKISAECSVKGNCKYCGCSLESLSFEDTTTLPRTVAEYIYTLMSAYGCSTEDGTVFIYIYNAVAELISKMVSHDVKDFDDKATGVAALFCINVIKNHPPILRTSGFLMTLSEALATVGFDDIKVENTLKSGVFGDTQNIYDAMTKVDVSLNYNFDEVFNSYATDEVKKLKKEHKMNEFNALIKQSRIDDLKIDEIVENIKVKNVEDFEKDKDSDENIEKTISSNISTFEDYIKNCCPETYGDNHEWKGETCIKCGINKNMKNLNEVYQKYFEKFGMDYILEVINTVKMPKFETPDITKILNEDFEKTKKIVMKQLNLTELNFEKLRKNIISQKSIIIPTLKVWTHTDKNEWTVEEILNVIVAINNSELWNMLDYSDTIFIYDILDDEDIDADDVENEDDVL